MKKGFTLIELLAVIIILGILTTLIAPKVVNMIEEAEKNTNMTSAQNLAKAAQLKAQNNDAAGTNENIIINYETGENANYLDYNGSKPEKGQIIILSTSEISLAVKIGDYCYIKSTNSSDILSQPYNEETCKATTSFSNDSWETISAYAKLGYIPYEIGDTKEIEMDIDKDDTYELYTVRLINKTTPEECNSTGFSQTACGIVIEFTNVLFEKKMGTFPPTNIGGWPTTELCEYLNTTFYDMLPTDLKNKIIDTYTISGHGLSDMDNIESNNKIYLLSVAEIFKNDTIDTLQMSENEIKGQTRRLDYYEINNTAAARIKTNTNNEKKSWWLRSAVSSSGSAFNNISSGYLIAHGRSSHEEWGVSPAFRIG